MKTKTDFGKVLRTLAGQVKEFKRDSFLTPAFMILEVVVETLIPLLMARIVDEGIGKGNMQTILLTGLMMIGLALAGLFTGAAGGYWLLRRAGVDRFRKEPQKSDVREYSDLFIFQHR